MSKVGLPKAWEFYASWEGNHADGVVCWLIRLKGLHT